MTKIDIFSGFLGAGKTTLIKKLIADGYQGEKLVLIENEFGQIGIDGGFLQECGIQITEMNSGCICCSLVGDFSRALKKVIEEYAPDRILIEPSGVGKLSDVIRAVQSVTNENVRLSAFTTVADAAKCKMYMKNFGEFYNDQVENASCIVLSHTQKMTDEKIAEVVALLREKNATATIVTTDWASLSGEQILSAMNQTSTLEAELAKLAADTEHEHHHHHHHGDDDDDECDDPDCECHHHHDDDDEDEHEHHHHHHHGDDDDDECDDPDCECHHHHDDDDEDEHEHHHHHHHADDVFTSWGVETPVRFTQEQLFDILNALSDSEKYGTILRSKGIVAGTDGSWIHFDYVPGEPDVRVGPASVIGRICVIGSHINKAEIAALFGVSVK
ncbi:MAG: GTP-binding protein [Eubacteriales bacterium]